MAGASDRFTNADTAADDVCLLAFTSGTTGQPKACMHFHRDVLAMADVVARHLLHTGPATSMPAARRSASPSASGRCWCFRCAFARRPCRSRRPRRRPCSRRSRSTASPACSRRRSPTARSRRECAGRDLASLKRCVSAGEFLPKAVSDLWFEKTGIRIIDGIGATEMIHIFIAAEGEDIRPGSTGKPLPGYRACVLDEDGQELPRGSTGRLAVTGPTGCRYLDDPRQRDYVKNGWNVTGDLYRLDEDGYFWFVARADDMIVSAGYNIAGPEVEWALLAHPAVRECAVIGAADAERGNGREGLRRARARTGGGRRRSSRSCRTS